MVSGGRRNTLWAVSTLTGVVLLLGYRTSTGAGTAAGPPASTQAGAYTATLGSGTTSTPAAGAGGGDDPTSGAASGAASSPSANPSASPSRTANARVVTGDTVQTQWGPVQVQITVAGAKITRVGVLQYPSGNPRDQEINSYALPTLTRETIDAQSAQIDMVSGATVTSTGYVGSLQSALDRAGL